MTIQILDIDVTQPLPPTIEWAENERLLLLIWKAATPVGMAEILPEQRPLQEVQLKETLVRLLGENLFTPPVKGKAPKEKETLPFISVVICTRNRTAQLGTCLDRLSCQSYSRFEVLVVDNAPSTGATREFVCQQSLPCRYTLEPNQGVRFARNRGISEAQGEIIAFVDDDCLAVPGWLEAIATNFIENPALGCCTGPVLPLELRTQAQQLMEQRGGFNKGFEKRTFTYPTKTPHRTAYPLQAWLFGTGGNMAFRRTVLDQSGPFDERLQTAEDLDMFFRIVRQGFPLVYEPAAAVRHRHLRHYRLLRRRLYQWGSGYTAYLLKVACNDPCFRRQALAEILTWFYPFQLRDRLWRQILHQNSEDFPLDLILAELAGGLGGIPSYFLGRLWNKPPQRQHIQPAPSVAKNSGC